MQLSILVYLILLLVTYQYSYMQLMGIFVGILFEQLINYLMFLCTVY